MCTKLFFRVGKGGGAKGTGGLQYSSRELLSSRATHCIQHVVSMWANTAINANTLHLLRLYTVFTLITLNRAQGASRRVSWTSPSPFTSNPFDLSHTLSHHVLFTHTLGLKHATFTLHQQYTHPVQPLPNLTQFLKSGKFWKKKYIFFKMWAKLRPCGNENAITQAAEKYCWAITDAVGRSGCRQSKSSVLVSGFQLDSLLCTYTADICIVSSNLR